MVDVINYAKKMHVELDIKPRADAYCEIHAIDRLHDFHEVRVVKELEVRGMTDSQIDEFIYWVLDEMTASIGSNRAMLYSQRLNREKKEEFYKFWRESTDIFTT